ncbi:MAG TPA: alpha/beta hydrolase-fold protein, partial [Pyrinomonadaceae bacterium]|nr:alpha/beta hydrolase-fold protein [Pyrinomonadaceae bacterium]
MNATNPAGTVVNLRHDSEVLKSNSLGDPHVRDLFVYLPPGYQDSVDRYPTVYCLTGFTGRGKMLLNDNAFTPNLAERLDKLIDAGTIRPMIAVMPNCFTYYGGSQYINSTATGRYEDYLTQEIVSFVDDNFRTTAERGSRAVMGKSSGGYGSLIMGIRHPDIFGLVCSTSGDAYFEYCYPPDFAKAFRTIKGDPKRFMREFWASEKQGKDTHSALNTIGMAACYSPNGSGFDLPFDLETGEMRTDVWERWLEHDPVRLASKHADNLRSLNLLYIDAGTRDEFNLDIGAKILSRKFKELDVPHIHEEFDDGHFNISYRYDRSLELIS